MKKLCLSLVLFSSLIFYGCTYPEPAKVEQKAARPAIGIQGAPQNAVLYVDGLKMGFATIYDGKKKVLLLEPGTHQVEIKSSDGKLLYSETVFLSSSTTKILHCTP